LAPVFCRLKKHLLQFDGIFSQDRKEMVFLRITISFSHLLFFP
jgi:hypothetical protein